jgi:hypothetical protein
MKVTVKFGVESEPQPPPVIQPPNQLWRVRHDFEIWKLGITWTGHGQLNNAAEDVFFRDELPEVFWCYGEQTVPMDEAWQRLSFAMCEGIEGMNWRAVYHDHRAFMNGTGFWHDNVGQDYDPTYKPVARRDYINRIDLSSDKLPAFDKVRVCGGATVSGRQDGSYVILDTLDVNSVPTLAWLQARPWLYFRAVSKMFRRDASGRPLRDTDGNLLPPLIVDFPQNGSRPSFIPLVTKIPVKLPVVMLEKTSGYVDPLKVYV